MEARKITVIQTRNQKKSVITSTAETLGELKEDLRDNGIDYTDMTFFEGISKIELKTDTSILPHDIPYKGQTTNELVFMLTTTNKKIRSGAGMSRAEVYNIIKSMGLQDVCIKEFGKNFTMCKTADLIALVENNSNSKPTSEAEAIIPEVATPVESANNGDGYVDTAARAAISKLVDILEDNGTIEDYEKDKVLNIFGGRVDTTTSDEYKPKSTSPYSDDEIDGMFDFIR